MAVTVSPFDMLRTVLMNQPTDRKIYSGCAHRPFIPFLHEKPDLNLFALSQFPTINTAAFS
jgi:hypothetical protein